jgi:hypothetical protein
MRAHRILFVLTLLLITACGRVLPPTPKPVDVNKVERVTVYSEGTEDVIQPDDKRFAGLAKHLLATLPKFNLQAECVFSEDQISAMKRKERLVELVFKAPERVTIGQWIPKEEREWVPTDERGFRVLTVKRALFALSGEYRGHLFLPSEGEPPMWGCWAIERRKEIDTRWIEAVEEALKE